MNPFKAGEELANGVNVLTGRSTGIIGSIVDMFATMAGDTYKDVKSASSWSDAGYRLLHGDEGSLFSFGVTHNTGRNIKADSEMGKNLLKDSKNFRANKKGFIVNNETGELVPETEKRYYDARKIAAAAEVPFFAYRFGSGGGIYRDKDGDVDIVGIPFI